MTATYRLREVLKTYQYSDWTFSLELEAFTFTRYILHITTLDAAKDQGTVRLRIIFDHVVPQELLTPEVRREDIHAWLKAVCEHDDIDSWAWTGWLPENYLQQRIVKRAGMRASDGGL